MPPLAMTSLRPWQLSHTVGGHPVRWRVVDEIGRARRRSRRITERRFRSVRRGGYHPPGCFPHGKTTSAQSADNAMSNICIRNSAAQRRNMVHCGTLCRAIPQMGIAGRLTIRPYELNGRERSANYAQRPMRHVCVGGDCLMSGNGRKKPLTVLYNYDKVT